MSETSAGRHVCDPPRYPDALGEQWTCEVCGAEHHAFDVHAAYAGQERHRAMLRTVPVGTLGWATGRLEVAKACEFHIDCDVPHKAVPVHVFTDAELTARDDGLRREAVEAAVRQSRNDWADWLANWDGAVTPTRPTIQAVIDWLRADATPFGAFAAERWPEVGAQTAHGRPSAASQGPSGPGECHRDGSGPQGGEGER